ncbi:hypothetical protein LSPH24S_03435 [Lysinibacillus sphaericus]
MTRKGIITGYPDKTFRPNDYIKRQHIAIMFARAFELEAIRETVSFRYFTVIHIMKLLRNCIRQGLSMVQMENFIQMPF